MKMPLAGIKTRPRSPFQSRQDEADPKDRLYSYFRRNRTDPTGWCGQSPLILVDPGRQKMLRDTRTTGSEEAALRHWKGWSNARLVAILTISPLCQMFNGFTMRVHLSISIPKYLTQAVHLGIPQQKAATVGRRLAFSCSIWVTLIRRIECVP